MSKRKEQLEPRLPDCLLRDKPHMWEGSYMKHCPECGRIDRDREQHLRDLYEEITILKAKLEGSRYRVRQLEREKYAEQIADAARDLGVVLDERTGLWYRPEDYKAKG